MNPFIAFSMEERKKLIADDPSLKSDIGKVGKLLGARWRKLSDAEKAKYKGRASTSKKTLKASKGVERKEKKAKRKGTRKLSGYMKFVKAERAQVVAENPKMKSDIMAVGREMGKRWRSMSDADKAKYA